MSYRASLIISEFNWQEFYTLQVIKKTTSKTTTDKIWYGDNFISELIGMVESDYHSYCIKNFNAIDLYKGFALFEWRENAELAKKWLDDKLEPLNLIEKLSE